MPEEVYTRLAVLWPFVVVQPNETHSQRPVVDFAGFKDTETQMTYNVVVCQLGEREFSIRLCVFIKDGPRFIAERTAVEAIKLLSVSPALPRESWRVLREFVGRYLPMAELRKLVASEST